MRRILSFSTLASVTIVALAVLCAGGIAAAQSYTPTEFQEYLVNAKKLHGKRVQMHAVFNSDEPVYSNSQFGEGYMKGNGIKESNHYRFSVLFRNQSKEWLYPVMSRKGKSHGIWRLVQKIEKGAKITLYGKLKMLGDTGGKAFVPGRTSSGGGFSDVPSVLRVERIMLGWVKTQKEYIDDLGGEAKLVAETIVMLTREGPGVLPLLAKVSQSTKFSDTVRANAARAIGAFKSTNQLGKLALIIKKAGDSEKIKNAALLAMAAIKPAAALGHIAELAGRQEVDDWVAYGAAELLAAGVTQVPALRDAVGDTWPALADELADALLEAAEDALEAKQFPESEGYATQAVAVDPESGPAYHLRGKARLAQVAKRPEAARLADADFTKALELGEESTLLLLHRAKRLLQAGDKQQAAELAEQVLEDEPKNVEARKIRAEAQGKSVAMIDSRLAKMNGVAVRVPSHWVGVEGRVSFKDRLYMFLLGADQATEKVPDPPATTLRVFVLDDPTDVPEGSRLQTPAETIDARLEANKLTADSRGTLKRADGLEMAWALCLSGEGAQEAKLLWVVVRIEGKVLQGLYAATPARMDAELKTLRESAATLTWLGE